MIVQTSVSLSGGASAGLGYFKLLHEIHAKNIMFGGKYFSMVSAGCVMGVPMLCGYTPMDVKDMLLSLGGDEYMRTRPKPYNALRWMKEIRMHLNADAVKTAERAFTWEKMMDSGRISTRTKPMIGVCKYRDLWRVAAKDLVNGIGDGDFTAPWKEIRNGNPDKLLDDVGIYWLSYDGTYRYYPRTNSMKKVSSVVTPLADAYMAAWSNIRLTGKTYMLPFGGKGRITGRETKERAFDLGIINNKANMIDDDTYSIACVDYPKTYNREGGLVAIDDYTYLLKPAKKHRTAKPTDYDSNVPFYNFSDERVNKQYEYGFVNWDLEPYFE